MERRAVWKLEVHYYPHIKPGLTPVDNFAAALTVKRSKRFCYYSSSDFLFDRLPTLEDFLVTCKRLAWTSVWEKSLFPLLNEKMWSKYPPGYKRFTMPLIEGRGRKKREVGKIEVSRDWLYLNEPYRP